MTISDSQAVIGVDVAKHEIVAYRADVDQSVIIANDRCALKKWLKTLPSGRSIALEATNVYHLETVELAHALGHRVFIVDPGKLNKYRDSLGLRAKTDASDARLLARYLSKEEDRLRIWSPPSGVYTRLKNLLHRRAALVRMRVSLKQSWENDPSLKSELDAMLKSFKALDQSLQHQMKTVLDEAGLMPQIKRCEAIEGVGFLTATGFLTAFIRGEFKDSDAYIAFLGLDLRVRDSGKKNGRRRLTKKGDPEVRRLGHNAAMAASRSEKWKPFYEASLRRGKVRTQALVMLTRKLARVAFSLMKNQTTYQADSMLGASPQT